MAKGQPTINVDTGSKGETAKYIVFGVVGIAVVGLAYFGIIKPILNTIGVTRDKEERQGDRAEGKLSRKQVLSPQLYRDNRDKVTISSAKASQYAQNVYDGKWGGCYGMCDDESKAVGSVTGAGSQVNISYVAQKFQDFYGRSMEEYMSSYLESENWNTIDNYIDKIKKF
jgi:hypothetical protein